MDSAGRDGNASINTGIEATQGMHLSKPLPFPTFTDQAPGGMSVADHPLHELFGVNTTLKHFVDIIQKAAADVGGSFMSNLTEEDVDKGFQFISDEAPNLGSEWKKVT